MTRTTVVDLDGAIVRAAEYRLAPGPDPRICLLVQPTTGPPMVLHMELGAALDLSAELANVAQAIRLESDPDAIPAYVGPGK